MPKLAPETEVPCTACGAAADVTCTTKDGRPNPIPHNARRRDYINRPRKIEQGANQRRMYLRSVLDDLRAANIKLANARDTLFGLQDAGYLSGEVASVKAALSVTITQASRQYHREFPND